MESRFAPAGSCVGHHSSMQIVLYANQRRFPSPPFPLLLSWRRMSVKRTLCNRTGPTALQHSFWLDNSAHLCYFVPINQTFLITSQNRQFSNTQSLIWGYTPQFLSKKYYLWKILAMSIQKLMCISSIEWGLLSVSSKKKYKNCLLKGNMLIKRLNPILSSNIAYQEIHNFFYTLL